MHHVIETLSTGLLSMRTQVQHMGIQSDMPFNQLWNWQQPATTRLDVEVRLVRAQFALDRLPEELPPQTLEEAARLSQQVVWFTGNVLPNLPGTNSMYVVPPLFEMLDRIEAMVEAVSPSGPAPQPYPDWEQMVEEGYLPKKVADRLRGIQKRVDALIPRSDLLEHQLATINDVYQSAEQFPENLAALEENKRAIISARTEVQSLAAEAASHARDASRLLSEITSLSVQSTEKYADLENAYKAASTRGLATSFQQRATSLSWSLRGWVLVLVLDLTAGAIIGYLRFADLQTVLARPQTAPVVWGNLIFSLLSIAAPVWLGWVATKQINQRFKLTEDYGYKATVASAYEAWKSEAEKQDNGKQDKTFGTRLFGTAMSRLEEAPLRLVETENYGSPWHELISSPAFSKAISLVPELKTTLAKIAAGAGGLAAGVGAAVAKSAADKEAKDE